MRIELIQPFINATDAVLAEMLRGPAKVANVSMETEVYRRKGIAATIAIRGDIEGRVIFDLDQETAMRVAGARGKQKVRLSLMPPHGSTLQEMRR